MKVNKISIKNILGLESLEITPGSVTEISGQNGSGKTSCLDAIRAALGSGHDATLLRQGAAEGEVVLLLEDGTEIKKRITEEKSDTSVVHPQFGKISKPASYIKKLADALSLNPVQFLTASKKDRVDQLLQAIPMRITADQIGFVPQVALTGIDLEKHALEVIEAIRKQIYDLRTGVNRSQKDKEATARQMSETLPADAADGDWNQVFNSKQKELGALRMAAQEKTNEIRKDYADIVEVANAFYIEAATQLERELSDAIEQLRAKTEAARKIAQDKRDARIDEAAKSRDEALQSEKEQYEPKSQALVAAISEAKTMIEQHAKTEKTREFIAQLKTESGVLDEQSKRFTSALSQLEVMKAGLLQKLPIAGLEVKDGDIYVDGVAFDRVNESKRIRLAIEIAKLRAGSLGLVAVDGLERLDPKTFETFKKEAAKSKLQFVVSRVTDGPLAIATEGKEVA